MPADPMSPTPAEQQAVIETLALNVASALVLAGRVPSDRNIDDYDIKFQVFREEVAAVLASLAEARRERDELRETALTADEATAILEGPFSTRSILVDHDAAIAKLSRISAGTPTEDRENE